MQNSDPENDDQNGKGINNYAKYSGIAFQMIAIICVFSYAGYRIDKAAGHTTQWVTAIFSLIGVFLSMYIIIRSLKA